MWFISGDSLVEFLRHYLMPEVILSQTVVLKSRLKNDNCTGRNQNNGDVNSCHHGLIDGWFAARPICWLFSRHHESVKWTTVYKILYVPNSISYHIPASIARRTPFPRCWNTNCFHNNYFMKPLYSTDFFEPSPCDLATV
jgi:hypothetical protein